MAKKSFTHFKQPEHFVAQGGEEAKAPFEELLAQERPPAATSPAEEDQAPQQKETKPARASDDQAAPVLDLGAQAPDIEAVLPQAGRINHSLDQLDPELLRKFEIVLQKNEDDAVEVLGKWVKKYIKKKGKDKWF